jgi:formylglycine-generating enzyme required for sulfatase activity
MASKPPDAFLSYTRFDDRRGAISAFRDHLQDAVQELTGEPFEIFQDVEGIGIGEYWPGKLDQMLDQARFFIPILTPSYFASNVCRQELEKFLRAEADRERNDLVLPVYYIETPLLEDPDQRAADPLAATLHTRQRVDWQKLRLSSFGTKTVTTALHKLAKEIMRARRRSTLTVGPSPGTIFRDLNASWCPELVVIPPGEFMMGSTQVERQWAIDQGAKREWVDREKPQRLVGIAYTLAVGRYPVTFDEYDHFARSMGRAQPGDSGWDRGPRPVINVSWEDGKAYAEWLAGATGQAYRLLSEAEWEYACRAGTTTRYWWGDEITHANANYGRHVGKTGRVGGYPASPFQLFDTHGNVWEWVEDRWQDSYAGAPDDGSAWITGMDSRRVQRGGSWVNGPGSLRSACRGGNVIGSRDYNVGLRVTRTLTP